jgi:lysophospholipase L1-like esterase
MKLFFFMLLSFSAAPGFPQQTQFDANTTEECRVRNGLPEFFKKVHSKTPVNVAYFGGSITAANGWRVKTFTWLKNKFPETAFNEINATISGTGSGFGACRVRTDVISNKPDLVFVEFRVNGGDKVEKQSVEGIVRQIRTANPKTDICFVYTIAESMMDSIGAGKQIAFGTVLETVANHYGIPTIDLGVEVMKRKKAGSLVFKADKPKGDTMNFTKDGVHPTLEYGHELYSEVITRNFMKFDLPSSKAIVQARKKIKQLFENTWVNGALISIENTTKSNGWALVDVNKDTVYRRDQVRTAKMLRSAYKCSNPGESITINWSGTTLAFTDICQNEKYPVVVEVKLDDVTPISLTRTQSSNKMLYARFLFLPELKNGKHTVTLTVKEIAAGESYYMGQFLEAGTK